MIDPDVPRATMKAGVYRNYLLGVLALILASNMMDRLALGLLLQDIKVDLGLSDTQLGFLSGIAFAVFYSVMGVPIARWADRANRVTLISITTGLWCTAVALCGLATTFLQLLVIRIGVAIGEAGCTPPAHSLIADYFQRAERARAVALYMLGGPLSALMGYFIAGWLNQLYGWRTTFVLLGLPGIALAVLARLTLREPRLVANTGLTSDIGVSSATRGTAVLARADRPTQEAVPSFREVCVTLWSSTSFRHLLIGFAVVSFFTQGIYKWVPTFFMRSYGFQTGELGTWLAVSYGLAALVGIYGGGHWASRHAAHDEPRQLRVFAILFGLLTLGNASVYVSTNHYVAFGFLTLTSLAATLANGPLLATIQTLVPDRMRATAIALIYLFANLVGMGLGPLVAGALSDALHSWFGEESLRYALLALCPGYIWAGWHLWCASRSIRCDIETVRQIGAAA